MSEIRIKVTPEALQAKAGEVSVEISNIENQWKKIQQIIKASKGYWEGDASNEHQQMIQKKQKENIDKTIKSLKAKPQTLLEMAGIYKGAETTAKASAGSLPTDII